ncbi:MAG TPA: HAMP domain-containing sensor histidine kinase [Pseudolabrys sp.]|nr:HAMP domain-containing sensor histidine kinase [Pseudolabrys sp.]
MRRHSVFQTTVFRLAVIYVAGFALAVAALGVATYLVTAGALERRLDARISREMKSLQADYRAGGLQRLLASVSKHEALHPNGALDYAVLVGGQKRGGHLNEWPSSPGWSDLAYNEAEGDVGRRRFLVAHLGQNLSLVVAADPEDVDEVTQAIFDGFLSAFGAVLVLGIVGGLALSLALLKRVETIRRTADAIIAGDLTRRIPLRGAGDDFDRLSQTLNRMLDRIAELMESLREVSAHIAHDLKTPLAHLRQRLETARAQPPGPRDAALDAAVADANDILVTFEALLRIAQIESGTRRAGFAAVDLSGLVNTVVDAFTPAAEDSGHILQTDIAPALTVFGDRELLTQTFANLIENAVRHTPAGTRIAISLKAEHGAVSATVADNGPGVPDAERERIFHRFHRLERSHPVAGSGLGLSLVKAVADIHSAVLTVEDAEPGLRIALRFPPEPQSKRMPGAARTAAGK